MKILLFGAVSIILPTTGIISHIYATNESSYIKGQLAASNDIFEYPDEYNAQAPCISPSDSCDFNDTNEEFPAKYADITFSLIVGSTGANTISIIWPLLFDHNLS